MKRHRPAPGQLTLDAALLTVILPTGRSLQVLPGRDRRPMPVPPAVPARHAA